MEAGRLLEELGLIDDALWAGLIFPEQLPAIATDLLVRGADTPALRNLAGLDLGRSDPRDERDVFADVMLETSAPPRSEPERLAAAAHLLAAAWHRGDLDIERTLAMFSRLAALLNYPDDNDVMRLDGLHDEWGAGWGLTNDEITLEVATLLRSLSAGRGVVPASLLDAVAPSSQR